MALTATLERQAVPGASVGKDFLVALDSSYPNPAGYAITPATFGFIVLRRIVYSGAATIAAGAYEPVIVNTYDSNGNITSAALHLVVGTTGVEVANAVNLSTSSLSFYVEGN